MDWGSYRRLSKTLRNRGISKLRAVVPARRPKQADFESGVVTLWGRPVVARRRLRRRTKIIPAGIAQGRWRNAVVNCALLSRVRPQDVHERDVARGDICGHLHASVSLDFRMGPNLSPKGTRGSRRGAFGDPDGSIEPATPGDETVSQSARSGRRVGWSELNRKGDERWPPGGARG